MGGGMMGGEVQEDGRKARPEEGDGSELWTTKSAILTPGDRVEFKLVMKKGETLFASATSDAFDPALELVDAKGALLAKNDDREEGDQSPFVAVRVPEAGTYTLRVLGFKQASGGKFELKTRTFVAYDAPLGPATHQAPPNPQGRSEAPRFVFRLAAKKDRIYDLKRASIVRPIVSGLPLVRIVGPTGVAAKDYETIESSGEPVFRALADGDYYLDHRTYDASARPFEARTDFREVAVVPAKPSDALTFDIQPDELKIVEMPVVPDLIVRTTIVGRSLAQRLSAPFDPETRVTQRNDPAYGQSRGYTWFLMNRDEGDDVVRVFHGTGTARFAIRSLAGAAQKVALKNAESLPLWKAGETEKGALAIGDVRLYLLRSTKSELMKVFAKSPQFQAKLDIFRLNGELANSLMDRSTHTASDDLYFPEADAFIVRLTCDGYGGSGEFTMSRDTLAAKPYALGTSQTMVLDGANFGLYEVQLEAGKRYQLTTDAPNKPLRADLLDEDGQFLTSQALVFDNVTVQYFVPTRSGRHRLWLRGAPGTRRFKFELHTPPKIGDR